MAPFGLHQPGYAPFLPFRRLAATLGVLVAAPLDGLVKPLDVMHEFDVRLYIPPACIHVFRAELLCGSNLLKSLTDAVGGFALRNEP